MYPEPANTAIKQKTVRFLTDAVFYLAILLFIIGFNFSDSMSGNWYQQFMPNIGPSPITDIYFVDSLTGYAVTNYQASNDTDYILKTTNSGDSWNIIRTDAQEFAGFNRVYFIDGNTGFTAGVSHMPVYSAISKTTDGGNTWSNVNSPTDPFTARDISILSPDTIWVVSDNSLTGGVFRTSNGGASWQQQLNLGSQNPDRIYMINGNSGFISKTNSYTRMTTNSGQNWTILFTGSGQGFYDIDFVDNLTGWGTFSNTRKTINGGLNWAVQTMPSGGNITSSTIEKLTGLNKDTVYGAGAFLLTTLGFRGMINRTTDGGENWHFQVPDSVAIQIGQYKYIDFVNKLNGWAYRTSPTGIHTTTGGDPVWITPVTQISSEVPKEYKLNQNYPNPFNPVTNIGFRISVFGLVKLMIFDVTGKETAVIVNEELRPGEYKTEWNASGFSSGVYFYSLMIDGKLIDTKRMILIK